MDSYDELWALLDVAAEVEWFINPLDAARQSMPRIADWMLKHPMDTLGHRGE